MTSPVSMKDAIDPELQRPYSSTLDNSVHKFVHSVKDNADVLYKLEHLGYFQQNNQNNFVAHKSKMEGNAYDKLF